MSGSISSGGYLSGYKTYITAIVGIITAIGLYLSGDVDLSGTISTVFPLISVICVRLGIASSTTTTTEESSS